MTITGVDDHVDDGDVPYQIVTEAAISTDPVFDGQYVLNVNVTNTDDDSTGIKVEPTSGLVTDEDGGTATFFCLA